jgi:hypothetical protein
MCQLFIVFNCSAIYYLFLALPETVHMPSARRSAECQTTGTRQTTSLPSVEPPALGEVWAHGTFLFCRVPHGRQSAT